MTATPGNYIKLFWRFKNGSKFIKNNFKLFSTNFRNAVISTICNSMKLNESIKNHPHGDRTRNSALRGRRLNQFDQRAISNIT